RGILGQAGGDDAIDRHSHDLWPQPVFGRAGIQDLQRPGATREIFENSFGEQGLNMSQGSIRAAESEMPGNFAQRRAKSLGVLFAPDEPENLLLSSCEFLHTGQSTRLAERGHSCPQQLANWKTASIRRPVGIYHVAADKNVRAPLNTYPSSLGGGQEGMQPGSLAAVTLAAAVPAGRALFARAGFIDRQWTSLEILFVECGNRLGGSLLRG